MKKKHTDITFQKLINILAVFWEKHGCITLQPIDLEIGAATFHPGTFFRAIGPKKWNASYIQGSRRPADARYGDHNSRKQYFYQYQVVLKPSPKNIQEIYIESLKSIGLNVLSNDLRFIEDNWESPTLGAYGVGWEVWLNGIEVSQITYFQQMGGLQCSPIMGELTYGIERLAMHFQNVNHISNLIWSKYKCKRVTYKDIFQREEMEMSLYNLKYADINMLFRQFDMIKNECNRILKINLSIPAYNLILKLSHIFNLLDSRGAISVTERKFFILEIRFLSNFAAKIYSKSL